MLVRACLTVSALLACAAGAGAFLARPVPLGRPVPGQLVSGLGAKERVRGRVSCVAQERYPPSVPLVVEGINKLVVSSVKGELNDDLLSGMMS
jgi:hypothetical protein